MGISQTKVFLTIYPFMLNKCCKDSTALARKITPVKIFTL